VRRAALWIAVAIGASLPVSTALDNVLAAALLVCWIASGSYREKLATIRGNPFALAAIGFFLLHVAGAAYSIGSRAEILSALDKASILLLVPVIVSLRPQTEWLRRALAAFLAALLVTLFLSFLVWWEVVPGGAFKGYAFDPVVFKLKITHSVLMAYGAFVLALAAREATDPRWRIALAAGAALAAFNVLFMVWGRTGQLVVLALFCYLLLSWFQWRGVLAAAAAGVVIGGTVYFIPSSSLHERTLTTVQEIEDWRAGKPATLANKRLETWSNSVTLMQNRPLFGFGTGGFAAAYTKKVAGTGMDPAGHAENQYLYTAMQLGLVGLIALVGLFAYQWRLAGRLATRTETNLARGLVILMAIGCLFNPFLHDHTEALFYAWLSGLLFAGLKPPAPRA
jgi:O-antigen ligase